MQSFQPEPNPEQSTQDASIAQNKLSSSQEQMPVAASKSESSSHRMHSFASLC